MLKIQQSLYENARCFPGDTAVKNPFAGDTQETHIQLLCPDSLGEGNGNLLQYSCLGNLMDKGA